MPLLSIRFANIGIFFRPEATKEKLKNDLQIVRKFRLADNLKALYFKILFHIKTVPKIA